MQQLRALAPGNVVPIERRDAGGRIGIDHDAPSAVRSCETPMREKLFQATKRFIGQRLALGDVDIEHVAALAVDHHQADQQQRDQHRRRAAPGRAGLIEPDGGRDGEQHAGRDHGVRSAEQFRNGISSRQPAAAPARSKK